MVIQRIQYAQKVSEDINERRIIHFETDSAVVMMSDGRTLDEFAKSIDGKRKITLTGGVTGTVETDGHSDTEIEVTVKDDSHEHSGKTINAGAAGRVVVTASKEVDEEGNEIPGKGITVTDVTTEELSALQGVRSNIQEQLDAKSEADLTMDPEAEPKMMYAREKFVGILDPVVNDNRKLVGGKATLMEMPRYAQFYNTSIEPTDQVAGDFWLLTLSVEVDPGDKFIEDLDGDKAKTEVVSENTEDKFLMTDLDSLVVEGAGSLLDYCILMDL